MYAIQFGGTMQNNIKAIRKSRGLTLAQLADLTETTAQQIGMLERGDRRLSDVWIERLANALHINAYELIVDNNVSPKNTIHAVPVLGLCQAGNWAEVINDEGALDSKEYLDIHIKNRRDIFAVKVSGDSMEPRFHEGEYLIVDPNEDLQNGRYIIAELHGQCTFKKYSEDAGQKYLIPENKRYQPIPVTSNDMHYVGTVIERVVREKFL